jgi:hypothetical protein
MIKGLDAGLFAGRQEGCKKAVNSEGEDEIALQKTLAGCKTLETQPMR